MKDPHIPKNFSDKNEYPFVSVIIICEKWNSFLAESIVKYRNLNYPNFEILVFTTEPVMGRMFPKVKFISDASTKNKPAEKRDLAMKHAKGQIYAFIDDDAYPSENWLMAAAPYFGDKDIAAVGGPGITPDDADIMEKASGWVTASPVGGFGSTYRFLPQNKREVDDFPSMNLIVRAEDFKAVKGFDSDYYPGEDTKLCLDLTKRLGKKIMYDPEILVYHHKRPLFKKHLIQNGRFGLHRGYFARALPETSRRWFYFIPSLFLLGNILGPLILIAALVTDSVVLEFLARIYLFALFSYLIILLVNSFWVLSKSRDLKISLLSFPGVMLTHLWYGYKFLQGFLFTRKTEDNYGRAES